MPTHPTLDRATTLALLAFCSGVLIRAPLRAQITILDQPVLSGLSAISGAPPSRVSDSLCGATNQAQTTRAIAEDFVTAVPLDVSAAAWIGGYQRLAGPAGPTAFTLVFHPDAAGLPGTTIVSFAALPARTLLFSGVDLLDRPVSVYSFQATFSPVHLEPGAYWLEIFETDATIAECFEWSTGLLDALRGRDGEAFTPSAPGSVWHPNLRTDALDNRALVLVAGPAAVAVPALAHGGLILLAVGLGFAALLALRR